MSLHAGLTFFTPYIANKDDFNEVIFKVLSIIIISLKVASTNNMFQSAFTHISYALLQVSSLTVSHIAVLLFV